MAKPNQVTGRVTIFADQKRLLSKEGAKLNTGGVERETVLGDAGVHGYSEKSVAPGIECTISHMGNTSLSELNAMTNVTLNFECDSGAQYVIRNAWLTKPCELSKGEVSLSFAGISCEEL